MFTEASKGLFRGPRPKSFKELRELGISAVINLQSGAYERVRDDKYEHEHAGDFGMVEYNAPCSDIFPPKYGLCRDVFYTLRNHISEGQKCYIHCLHGKDRTGFNVAFYRMKHDGVSFIDAVKEMFSFGFHKIPYLWWVPFLLVYYYWDCIQDHHTQDLRDNDRERNQTHFNKRGWFKKWRWQFVIRKNFFKMYHLVSFNVDRTARGMLSGFNFGLFGIELFISISKYDESGCKGYGFYTDEDALVIKWARSHWESDGFIIFLDYPWSYSHCLTEYINESGEWQTAKSWKHEGVRTETHPYTYVLKNGETQKRLAKVSVERRTWWQRWFGLGKFHLSPSKTRTTINVSFDGEVGEETGSWKGGTVGCGHEMLPGEIPLQTLRRMEKDRRF